MPRIGALSLSTPRCSSCFRLSPQSSDRWGRRPVLLLSLVGLSIDYFLMAWAPTLAWLFVGRVLSGICGAAMGTATAYVADITPKEKRSQRFGLIGAAFGLGLIVGPVIGGELGEFGPRAPFYLPQPRRSNVIFGFSSCPKVSRNRRRCFDLKRANPFGAISPSGTHPSSWCSWGAVPLRAGGPDLSQRLELLHHPPVRLVALAGGALAGRVRHPVCVEPGRAGRPGDQIFRRCGNDPGGPRWRSSPLSACR